MHLENSAIKYMFSILLKKMAVNITLLKLLSQTLSVTEIKLVICPVKVSKEVLKLCNDSFSCLVLHAFLRVSLSFVFLQLLVRFLGF